MNSPYHPKILITGANGQLAKALAFQLRRNKNVLFTGRENLDITDKNALCDFLYNNKPEIIINTAAYTAVDAAEKNGAEAFAVNAEAVAAMAGIAKEINSSLIHISTDYVFDGKSREPYKETDAPNPVTVYGKSKLAGEKAVIESGIGRYAVIRTSWLYSNYGQNFYKTMLRLSEQKKEISVVIDQTGSPTYAPHLAAAILKTAENLHPENSGIYHYSDSGITTWHAFAKEIFRINNKNAEVKPITSQEYPTAAKRPSYSVLDTKKIKEVFGIDIPVWQKGVEKCNEESLQ